MEFVCALETQKDTTSKVATISLFSKCICRCHWDCSNVLNQASFPRNWIHPQVFAGRLQADSQVAEIVVIVLLTSVCKCSDICQCNVKRGQTQSKISVVWVNPSQAWPNGVNKEDALVGLCQGDFTLRAGNLMLS